MRYVHYNVRNSASINEALAQLPIAEKVAIKATDNGEEIQNYQAVRVTMPGGSKHYVAVPTLQYKIVQHSEAFKPIIEGLTLSGCRDFKYYIYATPEKATMAIMSGAPGYDGVSLGFSVSNSYDSNSCLKYGFELKHTSTEVELVGYRQICSNGMKVRVPLYQAEIVKPEIVLKVKELFSEQLSLTHTKSITDKMLPMQYITEALELLRSPVEAMIKRAQKFSIRDKEHLKELIKFHVGKRYAKRVLAAYEDEPDSTGWALYNAITAAASHDRQLTEESRETLLNKGADLLLALCKEAE